MLSPHTSKNATVCNMVLNISKKYDYLVVGAGLFGSAFARIMTDKGKSCIVIDKRDHIAGNAHTKCVDGINVHEYGAHIFHTSNDDVWEFVNRFAKFNGFVNSPLAYYKGRYYHLPFNMNTFHELWGVNTAEEAKAKIAEQRLDVDEPKNLEEQALKLVGKDVYETLVKGYTEKQWGRDCKELPSFIIKRLPLRFEFDNNYFNDKYQGIPVGGYTKMVENMLAGIDVKLGVDFAEIKADQLKIATKTVYTGAIDEYFDFCLGHLEYRALRFETERVEQKDYQNSAVVNYTEREIPFTRIIDHKRFEFGEQEYSIITREYPSEWKEGMEPYYPVNDARNSELARKYACLAKEQNDILFGGRLGTYSYLDMDKVIASAMELAGKESNDKAL